MKSEEGCLEGEDLIFHYACVSDRGCVRKSNEDDFLVAVDHGIFAVADGVGGLTGGEIASKLALASVIHTMDGYRQKLLARIFRGREHKIQDQLKKAIQDANQQVYSSGNDQKKKFATTLVVLALSNDLCTIGYVGDSRAYLLRDSLLSLLTTDHTVAQELSRNTKISPDSPYHNIITRAIGADTAVEPDMLSRKIQKHDVLLLCSDGLTSMVSEQIIENILCETEPVAVSVRKLIQAAKDAGGKDNVTAILIKCTGKAEMKA